MEKYKIKKVKDGSFEGDNGLIEYWWYKALRLSDGITINFGSKNGDYIEGEVYDLDLEKTESFEEKGGKTTKVIRYKESGFGK